MGRLEGKVALITGGASGIGAATVRRFVAEGARVLIADLQPGVAADLAGELGPDTGSVQCNVAQEANVIGAIRAATERWGRLDVLFNNAGFGGATGPLEETSVADYDLTMDVLLKGVFLGIKHAAPVMKAQGGGSIINTASVCAFRAGIGATLYTVAKAAVLMLTQASALELAEHNIRVNAVCPGYITTPLAAGAPLGDSSPERVTTALDRLRARNQDIQPLARPGEPEDIADMVLFLASDEAGWVTGQGMVVDGGLLAGRPWRHLPRHITEHRDIRLYRLPPSAE